MTSKRWLTLILVLSLAVNLALLGYLAGRASMPGFQPPLANPMHGAGRILNALPETRREQLKPLLRNHLRDLRPNLRDVRSTQAEIRSAILDEPFDPAELRTALGHFQAQLGASQESGHESFIRFVTALDGAERALLVQHMNRTARPPGPREGRVPGERSHPHPLHEPIR